MVKWCFVWGLVSAACFNSFAQKTDETAGADQDWKKIGDATLNTSAQTGSIQVPGRDKFRAIRLKASEPGVTIDRVIVQYENGEQDQLELTSAGNENSQTRIVDVDVTADIRTVRFFFHATTGDTNANARIGLYGAEGNTDAYREERTGGAVRKIEEAAEAVEEDVENAAEDFGNDEIKQERDSGALEAAGDLPKNGVSSSKVKDQLLVGKMGPEGQNIYVDQSERYYFINDEGKKIYVAKSRLKDRPQ